MSRVKITAPNPDYSGTVGELQFSKGVYEGEAPDSVVAYCRTAGYSVEQLDGPAAGDAGDTDYESLKVADLKAEIDRRNETRDADVQLDKSGNKADLVAVLTADDEAASEAGDAGDQNGASS